MAKRGRKPKQDYTGEIQYVDLDDPGEYGGKTVDYATILWRQIDRIMKAGTYQIDEVYVTGVFELYRILEPYWDTKFIDWYNQQRVKYNQYIDGVEPNKQSNVMKNMERQFAHILFGKLVHLMTIHNLLPMKNLKPF